MKVRFEVGLGLLISGLLAACGQEAPPPTVSPGTPVATVNPPSAPAPAPVPPSVPSRPRTPTEVVAAPVKPPSPVAPVVVPPRLLKRGERARASDFPVVGSAQPLVPGAKVTFDLPLRHLQQYSCSAEGTIRGVVNLGEEYKFARAGGPKPPPGSAAAQRKETVISRVWEFAPHLAPLEINHLIADLETWDEKSGGVILKLSPDGGQLLVSPKHYRALVPDYRSKILETTTGEDVSSGVLHEGLGGNRWLRLLAFTPHASLSGWEIMEKGEGNEEKRVGFRLFDWKTQKTSELPEALSGARWTSPDGQIIALHPKGTIGPMVFSDRQGKVLYPAAGERPLANYFSFSVSADGKRMVFHTSEGASPDYFETVQVRALPGFQLVQEIHIRRSEHVWRLRLSRDGRYVTVLTNPRTGKPDSAVTVYDVATGQEVARPQALVGRYVFPCGESDLFYLSQSSEETGRVTIAFLELERLLQLPR